MNQTWTPLVQSLWSWTRWTHLSFVEPLQLLVFGLPPSSFLNSASDFGIQVIVSVLLPPLEHGLPDTQTGRFLRLDQDSQDLRGTRGPFVRVLVQSSVLQALLLRQQ